MLNGKQQNNTEPVQGPGSDSTTTAKLRGTHKVKPEKTIAVVTCSCGGKIPWDLSDRDTGFCPYCGLFLKVTK